MARLVIALFLLVAARSAFADRILVGGVDFAGSPLPESSREKLRKNFVGGLASSGLDVVPASELEHARRSNAGLSTCNTGACLRKLGEIVSATHSVIARIEMQGTSNYTFTLKLFDNPAGSIMSEVEDRCEVCTLTEANDKLSSCAATLREKISPAPAPAPKLALIETPTMLTTRVPERSHSHPYRTAAIVTLVVGVPALVAGAVLWAYNGRTYKTQLNSMNVQEMSNYQTLSSAIPLTVAGGALIVTSAVLFAVDAKQKPHRRVTIAPNIGKNELGATLFTTF